MNKQQIADYFRVKPRTINRYMAKGMPFKTVISKTNNAENVYDVEECVAWMNENDQRKTTA